MRRKSGGISRRVLYVLMLMIIAVGGCTTSHVPVGDRAGGMEADAVSPPPSRPPETPQQAAPAEPTPATASTPAYDASDSGRQATRAPLSSGSVGELPSLAPGMAAKEDPYRPVPHDGGGLMPIVDDDVVDPAQATETLAQEEGRGTIEINFDNADLVEVIRTLADILNIQYILDPGVQGSVTIHTAGGLDRENLFPLFFKILEVNGLTAVKEGPIFRITATTDASRLPLVLGRQSGTDNQIPPGERIMIQIIPLKHISAAEMSKLLVPFASEGATLVAHQASNTLVVVDKGDNVLKIVKMAAVFDIGLFERMEHRFYLLENATAKDTAAMLEEIFVANGGKGTVRFMPIERLNAVLALSADPQVFARTDQYMIQLDAPGEGIDPRIHVYFVKNGGAEELAGLLNTVFRTGAGKASEAEDEQDVKYRFSRNPFAVQPKKQLVPDAAFAIQPERSQPEETEKEKPSGTEKLTLEDMTGLPAGNISIIPDKVRNALLIECTPSDYRVITSILERIDVLPRQVLIEAMIAEISLDDRFQLGVEWEYTRAREDDAEGLISGTIGGDGLSYAVAFSQSLLHNLQTLASKNKVNILSSPHVLASDGKEAKIDVSDEIPIVSSETVISSSAEPLVTTDIQYRDTGVLLAVTPHINANGLVTMDVYQEISEQGEDVNVAGENYPSFFKRAVDTTLTVRDDQTIVLGGLIRENKSQNRSGVPGMIDVPFIGWLFGDRDTTWDKSELIVLLTPRVVTSYDDVTAVTEEFERKVGETMDYIRAKQEESYVHP